MNPTSQVRIITPALAVSASPDYSAGDSMGGKITIPNVVREPLQEAVELVGLVINDAANQKPVVSLIIFESNPTAATITDNAAFVFSTDIAKVIAKIGVLAADYSTTDSMATAELNQLACVLKPKNGANLYAALVVDSGTPNMAATTDLTLKLKFKLLV